jgi:hypothetical protein
VNLPEQEQLARKIAERLNEGLDRLEAGPRERLAAARRTALARYQPVSAMSLAGIGGFLEHHVFGARVAAALTALVIATASVVYWQSVVPNGDAAELEIALLTDELPINAYLDKGFDSWLKR